MTASAAEVEAAQEAYGCEPSPWVTGKRGTPCRFDGAIWSHCAMHHRADPWTDRGCPVAVAVADAVVAAAQPRIADAWDEGYRVGVELGESGDYFYVSPPNPYRTDKVEGQL